LLVVSCQ